MLEIRDAYTLTFLYDAGTLVGFNYDNGSTNAKYYYGIDNFGNINYIYDASGNIVVTYRYDAWGKPISTTVTASTWAALAVTAACLAIPGLNAVYAKCVALISTGVKLVPMVLTSILKLMPKFTAALF